MEFKFITYFYYFHFELIPKEANFLKPISIWTNENESLAEVAKKIRAVIEEDIITT